MYKLIAIFIFFFPSFCAGVHKYPLSICAIFQDEAPYLKEWIEFHRLVGVEHFYLYNHRSCDHYREVLAPYIASQIVELFDRPKVANRIKIFNRLQCKCYNECLTHAKGVSKWVAFLDIDEYLFPIKESSLIQVLSEYEEFGGVCANWRIFGTSGVSKIPKNQLMIEALTQCTSKVFPANRYIKSIVRPECASHFPNPHHPIFLSGNLLVNTDKIPFTGPFLSECVQTNRLCINHYWTRDTDFFYQKKIVRQKKWGEKLKPQEILPKVNAEKDEAILRFVPLLKKRLSSV